MRKLFIRLVIVLTTTVIVLLCVEIAIRVVELMLSPRSVPDDVLGWKEASNLTKHKKGIRSDGKTYDIVIHLGENGFRPWGNTNSTQRRLLVIGDSFTNASQVSDDKTYYALLVNKLGSGWQVFADGSSGYGTLQEYMILDRYWDTIKPDAVLWQWCCNDFCNNLFEWDNQSSANYCQRPRPYWEQGRIVMRCPREVPVLSWHSHAYQWLWPFVYNRLWFRRDLPVDNLDSNAPLFQKAVAVTDEILAQARKRIGRTPVFAFVALGDETEPYQTAFGSLAANHGIQMIRGIDRRIAQKEAAGIVTTAHPSIGGHWSEEGHAAIADVVYETIGPEMKSIAERLEISQPAR
ncbi:MAG: SGNH/GDSL hydrolase family protein [Verrucomicrobia bacterium]|nr:SGNH/GDSL hydrolase family protein [Verrucomicrobiota bacterium]